MARTDPDLHLIKQVEQVTMSALERPAWHLAGIPRSVDHGRGTNPRISDLAITALAVIWLQKQPGAAEGHLVAERQSGDAIGPHPAVPRHV